MRKVACAFGLVLAMSATAAAQKAPKTEVFLGYSYVWVRPGRFGSNGGFNTNGGSLSLAFNLNNFLGVVGDVGIYHRRPNANAVSYLFGPRLSVRRNNKITPYGQVLFGGAHVSGLASSSGGLESGNAFAMTVGWGVDAKLSPHLGLRLIQAEYFMTKFRQFSSPTHCFFGFPCFSTTDSRQQNNVRLSAGVVFRFGK